MVERRALGVRSVFFMWFGGLMDVFEYLQMFVTGIKLLGWGFFSKLKL